MMEARLIWGAEGWSARREPSALREPEAGACVPCIRVRDSRRARLFGLLRFFERGSGRGRSERDDDEERGCVEEFHGPTVPLRSAIGL